MQSFIFYASYLSLPVLIALIFLSFKLKRNKAAFTISLILVFLNLTFVYSRFIERNIITQNTYKIEVGFKAKIVLFADPHLGIYKNAKFLNKVVQKVNKIKNVDAVLIAGDFIYYPNKNLKELFYPLKDLKKPTYAVLGNHDSGHPGPPIAKELIKILENNNINFLHNESIKITDNITLLGLGDKWASDDNVSLIDNFKEEDNLLVMTHNPDTLSEYKKNSFADLTLSGHTHGGQIRIPFIYKSRIPTQGDFDQGLYNINGNKLFITSGVGEVGLPMRLAIPPVIDILELY